MSKKKNKEITAQAVADEAVSIQTTESLAVNTQAAEPTKFETTTISNEKPQEESKVQEEHKRIFSIDRFRGFCIFAMIIFQFLKNFPSLGFLSRLANHSLEQGIVILPGMTLADIIAPAFIFAIGLTFALSFSKWQRLHGTRAAIIHYLERALAIIGVGTFLDLCNKVIDGKLNNVDITILVFSAIAIVGLILRLLALIPSWKKKLSLPAEQIFYIALSILGIINIVINIIDFVNFKAAPEVQRFNYWVTLQGIGFAILIALPFVKSKSWVKFLGALLITIAFSVFHQLGDNRQWLDDYAVHGGAIGGFGWGAMLIFDMFIADLYFSKKYKPYALVASLLFCSLGIILTQWMGTINMGSCSPTFILVGVGLSGIIFALFDWLDRYHKYKFDPLVWWGKNPIVMFLIEFFVVGIYTTFMPEAALAGASWWLALIQGVVLIVGLTAACYGMSRSKKSISL